MQGGDDCVQQFRWAAPIVAPCGVEAFNERRLLGSTVCQLGTINFLSRPDSSGAQHVGCGRMVYGRPEGRPHNRYLDWLYEKVTGRPPRGTLADTIRDAVQLAEANWSVRASV